MVILGFKWTLNIREIYHTDISNFQLTSFKNHTIQLKMSGWHLFFLTEQKHSRYVLITGSNGTIVDS